jgi:hypothetical protein
MRCIIGSGFLTLFLPLLAFSAENAGPPVLEGIVNVTEPNSPPLKRAVLRIGEPHKGYISWSHSILLEGDRDRSCEVTAILPEQGKVVVKDVPSGAPLDLYLTQPLAGQEPPSLQFRGATFWSLIDVLQEISDRSVLAPTSLSEIKFDLLTPAYHTREEAAAALKEALRNKDLIVEARGQNFLVVLPSRDAVVLKDIPDPPPKPVTGEEVFPPGLLRFSDADIIQVLDVYQELAGRTLLRPTALVPNKISLRSQTQLDRPQAIWMLNAALRLGGVSMINESNKFVFAVPPTQTNSLPHIDPKRSATNTAANQSFPPGLIKFNEAQAVQVLEIYATLIGRTAVTANAAPGKISVRSQTTLDLPEVLYVLESVAALNNVAFDLSDPEKVSVIRAAGPARQ